MAKQTEEELDRLELEERKVKLEHEQLQLEIMRDQVAKIRAKQDQQKMSHEQVEASLKDFQESQERGFSECNHRKGGKNLEGARGRGTDDKYAIIRHQLPFGQLMVICTRCHKVWLPPSLAEKTGKKPDPEGYNEAVAWPTDNEDSGSSLFIIVRGEKVA